MAFPSSLLCEEQFQCSICLDIFTSPVTTPCGHNFCMVCIGGYWDSSAVYQCPLCKETFPLRPDLRVNRSFEEIIEQFKQVRVSPPEEHSVQPRDVPCDICIESKLMAVKSCLVCLASYCETHLEPHQRVKLLKRHKLINPVNNLEDRLCKKHDRVLELFCRKDQICICQFCTETDHRTHNIVTLEEECRKKKAQLGETEAEVQQMIQDKLRKVEEIRQSVEFSKSCAQREAEDSVQVFSALVRSIEKNQAELTELIEAKQRAAEKQAEGLIEELEQEITALKRRHTELEQISHTEDHIHFLQSFPALCPLPHTKDWSDITVTSDPCLGAVRRAVSQLEERVGEELQKLSRIELKKIQQYAADVTLDSNTAHPRLYLSRDGKQVRLGDKKALPDNPERFKFFLSVLGKEGFSSGRHYWEVDVQDKTEWVLGVTRESVNRKGRGRNELNPENGYWTVWLRDGNYFDCTYPFNPLPLNLRPQKLGVYVDYEGGQVSFYDVEARSHIYTFSDTFTEKLYPYFNPCTNEEGINAAPLIISPVCHTD